LAITTASTAVARRKASALELAAGALVFWFLAAIALTIRLSASSYVFTWVLFSGSLALLLALALQGRRNAGL